MPNPEPAQVTPFPHVPFVDFLRGVAEGTADEVDRVEVVVRLVEDEVGRVEVEVRFVEDEDDWTLLHLPNWGLHPVPQYAMELPLLSPSDAGSSSPSD